MSKPAILGIGDSRTYGTGAVNGTSDWVTQFGALGGPISATYDLDNRGTPGRLLDEIANTLMDALVLSDANPLRSSTTAWLWAGVNDSSATGAQLLTWTTTFASRCRSAGFKVGVILELPNIDAPRLATLNGGILSLLAAGSINYAARTDLEPHLQNPADATYFSDGLHLTPAGYAIIAARVKTAMGL